MWLFMVRAIDQGANPPRHMFAGVLVCFGRATREKRRITCNDDSKSDVNREFSEVASLGYDRRFAR